MSLLDDEAHRARLERGVAEVLTFALPSIRGQGGFDWLDADGRPLPDRPPQLYLTARMAYAARIGIAHRVPGAEDLLDHAVGSLLGLHADSRHGGWLTEPGRVTGKACYDHMHVALAAAAATEARHPDAPELLTRAVEVIEDRFWEESTGTLAESFAEDWSDPEPYRGANANMHGVEAFLALGRATADPLWPRRALRIAERLVHRHARAHDWLLPEHYTADWRELPEYHHDQPEHPFRPYGATLGHSLEWARFLIELDSFELLDSPPWLVEAAVGLAGRALDQSWAADGRPGLVYTVDWTGRPVSTLRLHWPVCEALQASAALAYATGETHWAHWYDRLWEHAETYFIEPAGTWRHELGPDLSESGTLWPGRVDVYHCVGAYAGPLAGTD